MYFNPLSILFIMVEETSLIKTLIAEDDSRMQSLINLALAKKGPFEIRFAANGVEAMEIYEEWKPDLVLLDIMMPLLNGYQTLKEIRQTHDDNQTTVIMLTSVSAKSEIVACVDLGIQGYIVKPFNYRNLSEKLLEYHQAAS